MSQLGNAHNPAHAALLGSQNAVTCPLCHKLFLGGDNLMEHMKHTHKDPNATGVASKYFDTKTRNIRKEKEKFALIDGENRLA